MNRNKLIKKLNRVEKIASVSKFKRMLMHPFKYFNAILFRELIYKRRKVEKVVSSITFFGTKMNLLLPSSTDIYLTGGKSHDSEIRLAKFLINNLKNKDVFVDVGSHYGYFTLLGSKLVGNDGKVYSFEASPSTFKVLSRNAQNETNIKSFNLAVSDEVTELMFYEFPNLYSEYNTLDINQFKNENWFSEYKPKQVNIQSVILDKFLLDETVYPKIIKIDVEGAENKVINGLKNYLSENSPFIVMEYLSDQRGNEVHQKAENKLNSLGYFSFVIDKSGNLRKIDFISKYLEENNLESDNIVFSKKENAS
ncbi:MAG: FkbM family methyltransferase [Bacteroidetes bacterium OLB9]|nr:MAG: FkbM family methyltransferase [Bacteroidetes bacterium OLB9]